VALAALSKAGVKAMLSVGMLGAELGRRIPTPILAENAAEIARGGGYLGAYEPQGETLGEFLRAARLLLQRAPSFMLTAT